MASESHSLQPYEPTPDTVYTIETTAQMVNVSRRVILIYCKHGLVSPLEDPESSGYHFNDEAIRMLRRIEHLRNVCGISLAGTKMILDLMNEVESLRSQVRFLRR